MMADNFVPMNLDSLLGPADEKKAKKQQEQPAGDFVPMDLGHVFGGQDGQAKSEAPAPIPAPIPKPAAPALPPPTNEADPRFTREYQMLPKDAQGNAVVPLPIPFFEGTFPAVKLPTGQKSETIPVTEAAGKLLDYAETLPDPPKNVMDWMTRVVPESTAKTAIGLVKFMFHDLPRPFTDAVIQYAQDVMAAGDDAQAGQKPLPDDVVLDTLGVPTIRDRASDRFFEALGKGVSHLVNGLARFSGEPIGVYGWDKMKQAWMQNPAGALLGIAPFITKGMEARSSRIHQQSIEAGAREAELNQLFDQPKGLDKYKELSERLDQRQEKVYKTKSGAISAASYFEDALGERVEVIELEDGGFKIKRSGKPKEVEQAEAAQVKQAAEEKFAERKQKKYQTLAGAKSAARYFEDKLGEQVTVTKHEDGSFRIERTGKPIKREAPIDEYIASVVDEEQAGEYAGEASDATRIREDEGQVHEGGAVEEGSTEEGSKNLEQQPQEQSGRSEEASTKEEVSQTLDSPIIFPEGTDLDGMLAELQSQPPSIEQAVDVEIVKINQLLRDKGPNVGDYIEDAVANISGMYADLDSLMVAFPDADWDSIELKIQGVMDLWDRLDSQAKSRQNLTEHGLMLARQERDSLRSEAEHKARMEHERLKEAALDAAERGAAAAKEGAVKPNETEIEQARVMLAEGLSTYIKKLYRFGAPLDKHVEADLWSQIERKVGKSAATSLKARFDQLENSGRMKRLVKHTGELIDAFAYELAQGIKAGEEAGTGKAKPAKPEPTKNLLTKDQELLIKALYRLKDDPEKFAEGLMWARDEGVVDRTFAEAIRDNFDLLKKAGTTDRVMSSVDRMRNSFSTAVSRTLKKRGETLRIGIPLPKIPEEVEEFIKKTKIAPSKPGEYPWDRVETVLRRQGLDSRYGHDLYAGIPTKEFAKLFGKDKKLEKVAKVASRQKPEDPSKIPLGDGVATLQDVENYFDKVRKKSNPPIRETLKAGKEEAIKAITDTRGLAKRDLLRKYGDAGYRAIQRMSLLRGSPAKTFRELEILRKKVYKGLSKKMSGFLDEIIYGMRVVQIDNYRTGIKHPDNLGGDVFEPYLKRFAEMKGISESEAANLMGKANKYFKFLRSKLDEMLDEGLISKEEHSDLIKFNYSRRQAIDKIDPKRRVPGKGKVTVRDSGIESLAHGRATELLELDSKLLAAEVLGRANARIFKNRMNRELSRLAELEVDGPLIKKPMLTKKGKVKSAPPGWTTMSYMDNGELQSFYVPESFAMDLGRTHSLGYMESNLIRTLSGSGLLRAMATGINWSFPLVNFMRDISTVYLASGYYRNGEWKSTYSNILPVGVGQIGKDLAATFVDTLYKGKKYQEAMDQGLGMELLTTQGRFSKRRLGTDTTLDHLQETLGAFGTFGETWVRMALKHRGERLGMDPVESTFLARDYLDFSDFGYLTKTIDTQVPYLMATINATRSLWRSARRDPSSFIAKSLQIGAVSYALRSMMNRYFPDDSDKVSEYDKYHSWNIMLPASFTENGEKRRLYFKLPKDPSQQFIAAAFEAMADIQAGKEVDFPSLVDMLKSLSPIGEIPIAPSAKMLVEYFSNIDLWRAAQIANPSVKASEQWDVDTHPAMRELGRIGISPKRASVALRNILPPSNSFIGLASLGYKQLIDQVPEDIREDANYHMLTQIPITDRFFGATREVFADRKQMKEVTVEEGTKAHIARRSIDMAFKNQSADAAQALIANESDPSLRKIMIEQYHLDEKMSSLQFDTTWWRAFLTVPAAGRGKIYNDKVMELQGEALDKFLNDARLLGSIFKGETLRSIQIDQAQRSAERGR